MNPGAPFCNVFDPTDFAGDPPAPRLVVNETMRIACWNVDRPSTFKLVLTLRDSAGHQVDISTPDSYYYNPDFAHQSSAVSLLIPPAWWASHYADGPYRLIATNRYSNYTTEPFPVAELVTPICTWPESIDSTRGFRVNCTGVSVHLAMFFVLSSQVVRLGASDVYGLSTYYGPTIASLVDGCNPARLADPFLFDCPSTVASQLASQAQSRGGRGFLSVVPRIQTMKNGLTYQSSNEPGEQVFFSRQTSSPLLNATNIYSGGQFLPLRDIFVICTRTISAC
eukprot:tig00020603_g11817.t1